MTTIQQLTNGVLELSRQSRVNPLMDFAEKSYELHERVKVFEAVVWFPVLQPLVNGTTARGMSGFCRDIKIMTWCCAGRCLVQLDRGGVSLTLITADDEKPWQRDMCHVAPGMGPMGVQSLGGEFWDVAKMLYEATRYGDEIILNPDDNVTIG